MANTKPDIIKDVKKEYGDIKKTAKDNVRITEVPYMKWKTDFIRGAVKQENIRTKMLAYAFSKETPKHARKIYNHIDLMTRGIIRGTAKTWTAYTESGLRDGLNDVFSSAAGYVRSMGESLLGDMMPHVTMAVNLFKGIGKIGLKSFNFLKLIMGRGKSKELNVMEQQAELLEKLVAIQSKIGDEKATKAILEDIQKSYEIKNRKARIGENQRIIDAMNNELSSMLTEQMKPFLESNENLSKSIDLLKKSIPEMSEENKKTSEEELKKLESALSTNKKDSKEIKEMLDSITVVSANVSNLKDADVFKNIEKSLDNIKDTSREAADKAKADAYAAKRVITPKTKSFISELISKILPMAGLIVGPLTKLLNPLSLLSHIPFIGPIISRVGAAIIAALFGRKVMDGPDLNIPNGPSKNKPYRDPKTGKFAKKPIGMPNAGKMGGMLKGAGKLTGMAVGAAKIGGAVLSAPLSLIIGAGLSIMSFMDGFDDNKAKKLFGDNGTLEKIGSGLSSLMSSLTFGLVSPEKMAENVKKAGTAVTTVPSIKPPDYNDLGSVAARFESGSLGAGAVSSGKGDHGGVSYGTFQLSTKQGMVDQYVKQSKYASEFEGLKAGSPEFSAKWKELAGKDPNGFGKEQHDFMTKTNYRPMTSKLASVGLGFGDKGKAVQEALWSTSVQYGPGLGANVIKKSLGNRDLKTLSDDEIVSLIQDYKAANVNPHFSKSSEDVRKSISNRIQEEKKMLLAVSRNEAKSTKTLSDATKAIEAGETRLAKLSQAASNSKEEKKSVNFVQAPQAPPVATAIATNGNDNRLQERWNMFDGPMIPLVLQNTM